MNPILNLDGNGEPSSSDSYDLDFNRAKLTELNKSISQNSISTHSDQYSGSFMKGLNKDNNIKTPKHFGPISNNSKSDNSINKSRKSETDIESESIGSFPKCSTPKKGKN